MNEKDQVEKDIQKGRRRKELWVWGGAGIIAFFLAAFLEYLFKPHFQTTDLVWDALLGIVAGYLVYAIWALRTDFGRRSWFGNRVSG